jgi:integrase
MFDTMASVTKRGNGYRILVSNGYDIYGKKIQETITFTPDASMTQKQQEKALEKFVYDFEEKVKNGKFLKGEKITFQEFTETWLKDHADNQLQKPTYIAYKEMLDERILPAIGHLKLSKIQPMHLQSFYNNLLEDGVRKDGKEGGYSPSTIKKCHAVISSIMKTAVYWQVIDSNPCERVAPPKDKRIETEVKHFTLEQTEAFLIALEMEYLTTYKAHDRINDTGKKYHVSTYTESRSIPTQFKVFFNLALFGGMRRGELIALTWDDISIDKNTISITKSTGYAGKEMITKAPKNKSSVREITIPEAIINMIKKYRTEQLEYKLSIGDQWKGDNYVFIQSNGRQMNLSTPYHCFKDIIKKYNATVKPTEQLPDIPLHGLRHTSATLLISENVDVRTVSARLGHAQTSTTMNIYAHSLKKSDERASNVLGNILIKNQLINI